MTKERNLATPCGLYCGACFALLDGKCHGCACVCGECAESWQENHCDIAICARDRKLESCANCAEMPCTRLIQFCHDPFWVTHAVVIDNLHRRKRLGTKAWLEEQKAFWSNEENLKKEISQFKMCGLCWKEWKQRAENGEG
jgi:hypothetical protein